MSDLGKQTFETVLAADNAETGLRELSDHAVAELLDHTDTQTGWAARLVNGLSTLEAARRYRIEHKDPAFP
ncbi:MAG: hypothetical protein ACNA8L_10355 [Luteolibacter sp.]